MLVLHGIFPISPYRPPSHANIYCLLKQVNPGSQQGRNFELLILLKAHIISIVRIATEMSNNGEKYDSAMGVD